MSSLYLDLPLRSLQEALADYDHKSMSIMDIPKRNERFDISISIEGLFPYKFDTIRDKVLAEIAERKSLRS